MKEQKISREERILAAATEVFTQKGYHGTTTRDIAEAAEITLSSLHYYYRSKEKLFDIVAHKALQQFAQIMDECFADDIPFHEKIIRSVHGYIDLCIANPFLPSFIINEGEKNPEKIYSLVDFESSDKRITTELEQLISDGIIRPMNPYNFIENLVGLTIMPFLTRQMRHNTKNRDETRFLELLEERKVMVPDMMIRHMYYNSPLTESIK